MYMETAGRAITMRNPVVKNVIFYPVMQSSALVFVLSVYEKVWEAYQYNDCSLLPNFMSKHVSSRPSDSVVSIALHKSK